MCTVLLPPGDNTIAFNKYIKKPHPYPLRSFTYRTEQVKVKEVQK